MASRLRELGTVCREHFPSHLLVHLCRHSCPACPREWNCWLLSDVPHPALVEASRQLPSTVTPFHTLITVERSQQLHCSHPCQHSCYASFPVSHSSGVWCYLIMVLVKEPFHWSPCFWPVNWPHESNHSTAATHLRAPGGPPECASYYTPPRGLLQPPWLLAGPRQTYPSHTEVLALAVLPLGHARQTPAQLILSPVRSVLKRHLLTEQLPLKL